MYFEGHPNGSQVIVLNRPEQLNALNQGLLFSFKCDYAIVRKVFLLGNCRNDQLSRPMAYRMVGGQESFYGSYTWKGESILCG